MFTHVFTRSLTVIFVSSVVAATAGCSSIQSDAVRSLITVQGQHLQDAAQNAAAFETQTTARTKAYRNSLNDIDNALQIVQRNEAQQALIFSSNQNISTKVGVDANAAAYLIAALYFADYAGLQKEVKDQFAADYKALEDLSSKLKESWASLVKLHAQIENYSKRSGLASVDPAFISALLQQTRIDSSDIDRVIKSSEQVNSLLTQASRTKSLQGLSLDRDQRTTNDLIDLLNRVKQTPAK